MCGIFGVVIGKTSNNINNREEIFNYLARLSQTRGRDSSGIMIYNEVLDVYNVFKGASPIKELIKTTIVKDSIKQSVKDSYNGDSIFFAVGHSRLATNGTQISQHNNQPIIRDDMIAVHNGIIVNDGEIWSRHTELNRLYEIDTEVYLALINKYLKCNYDMASIIDKVNSEIEGTVSIATVLARNKLLLLHSNNGSLYIMTDNNNVLVFASEYHILKKIGMKFNSIVTGQMKIINLNKGSYCICDYGNMVISVPEDINVLKNNPISYYSDYKIDVNKIDHKNKNELDLVLDVSLIASKSEAVKLSGMLEYNEDIAKLIKRCSNCLLPDTFPFIEFDEHGVCNYCHNYKVKNHPKNFDELVELVEPYRSKAGEPDCIVPFSGGRDSTYALHLIKNKLKLNPIAYTYDWGMVTDLGRRNIARVCGKLGVENIIVAADIRKKRLNIKKNLNAWLQKPHLGMLPILMAGDKYFYYYIEKVKRQTGIKLNIWGVNPLENTDFKVGFVGVSPDFNKKYIYSLSLKRKFKLISSMAAIIAANHYYINSSVFDTLGSFFSRSIMPHRDYYHLFDYYKWDEKEIDDLISSEYNWEKSIDTTTTWRIGDGTAAFYNYVYFTVAGFSEHDSFRSNQIREGAISRDDALKLVVDENRPRYATIKWYLDTVGLDFERVISIINNIPKLYR